MTAIATGLARLGRSRPEWQPWLSVVEEALREIGVAHWDRMVPTDHPETPSAPRLAGAEIAVVPATARRLLLRLLRVASRSGTPEMATLERAVDAGLDVLPLFAASLCQDEARIGEIGASTGADPAAFQAVVTLLTVPFLQACRERWASSLPLDWLEGHCPVCASRPAFAELRGIERSRCFRCARCGSGWHARGLHCPFCGTRDHDDLSMLVPEGADSTAAIEACRRCRGYVKALNRLQGCPPAAVMIEDLASVELDIAAIEQGFERRHGAGSRLDVRVIERPGGWRLFAGRA